MAQSRYYSATAQPTVLTAGITPSSTIINVQQTVGFPASVPYILALDYGSPSEEVVLVTVAAGTNLTVTRAYDGTSATSHNAGAAVRHTWTAVDGTDSRAHEGSASNVHGVTGNLVGETQIQTLTNKTLTSPTITGTVAGNATYNTVTLTSPTITGTAGMVDATVSGTLTANIERITATTDVSLSSTGHGFQIGPSAGVNLRADGNELMSVNNGATSTFDVQSDGGDFRLFNNRTGVADNDTFSMKGKVAVASANTSAITHLDVNSASGSSTTALLQTMRNNGTTRFSVRNDGLIAFGANASVTSAGNLAALGTLAVGSTGQFAVSAAGDLTAANNITAGAWTAFTPTWGSSGVAPAIGNGSIAGRYRQIGKSYYILISWLAGSTTTFGTGEWTFSLPVAAANIGTNQKYWTGTALGINPGIAYWPGICQIESNTSVVRMLGATAAAGSTGSRWTNTVPQTWANTHQINVSIEYEAA